MNEDRSTLKRRVALLVALLAVWLGAVGYARMIAPEEGLELPPETVELSRQEVRRLSQLHGTNVIKIERETVSILRGGRWIPLNKRDRG